MKKMHYKKLIFLFTLTLISSLSHAQWVTKYVNNGIDDPYKIAYSTSKEDDGVFLKIENVEGGLYFYVQGSYFCEESPYVEMSFLIGNEYDKYYSDVCWLSEDQSTVFILEDLLESNCIAAFKKSSLVKISITDETCGDSFYTFSMSGSSNAFNYVLNQ